MMVLTLAGDRVAAVTGFPDPELFPIFDLPQNSATPTTAVDRAASSTDRQTGTDATT